MTKQEQDIRHEIARTQYDRDFCPPHTTPFNRAYIERRRLIELKLAHEAPYTNEIPND